MIRKNKRRKRVDMLMKIIIRVKHCQTLISMQMIQHLTMEQDFRGLVKKMKFSDNYRLKTSKSDGLRKMILKKDLMNYHKLCKLTLLALTIQLNRVKKMKLKKFPVKFCLILLKMKFNIKKNLKDYSQIRGKSSKSLLPK